MLLTEEQIEKIADKCASIYWRLINSRISKEDLLGEARLAILRGIGEFDSTRGMPIENYLCLCAINAIKHAITANYSQLSTAAYGLQKDKKMIDSVSFVSPDHEHIPSGIIDPAISAENNDTMSLLLSELDRLPESERDAIKMSYLYGMTIADVAKTLGKSKSAVAMSRDRGIQKLRSRMGRKLGISE